MWLFVLCIPSWNRKVNQNRKKSSLGFVEGRKEEGRKVGRERKKVWSLSPVEESKIQGRQKWKVTGAGKESATLISPLPFKDNTSNTEQ